MVLEEVDRLRRARVDDFQNRLVHVAVVRGAEAQVVAVGVLVGGPQDDAVIGFAAVVPGAGEGGQVPRLPRAHDRAEGEQHRAFGRGFGVAAVKRGVGGGPGRAAEPVVFGGLAVVPVLHQ